MTEAATGSVAFKKGTVSASKVGFVKVKFEELDGMETQWIPVAYPKTQNDKCVWTLDIGEHVACIMDANLEDGCVIGAIYSEVDVPPVSSKDKFHLSFKDGGMFEYDRASGDMTITAKGNVNVTAVGEFKVSAAKINLNEE